MAKRPTPHGVLLIDKPVGITSFDVLRRLRRIVGTKKLGHAGTLDPFASGLLVVCVGEYTRFAGYLTDDDKQYLADVRLGVATNTDDLEGEVISTTVLPSDWDEKLPAVLENYRGTIEQRPPAFSAIHVDGQRAYALARQGEDVVIPSREITVQRLTVEEVVEDGFSMTVEASKGTYIRALARDIGAELGVGGHLRALRRTQSGAFHISEAHTLEALELASEQGAVPLLLGKQALRSMPSLVLNEDEVRRMRFGQAAPQPPTVAHGLYALYAAPDEALLGLGDVRAIEGDEEAVEGFDRVLRVRRLLPQVS